MSIDPETVTLGDPMLSGRVGALRTHVRDVNRDGHPDRVFFFRVRALVDGSAINRTTTRLVVRGKTRAGISIIGMAAVRATDRGEDDTDVDGR